MSMTAGERRIVSVLVADVVGSTAIGERLGPERSKFLFDEVVRLMREEVERFGGTVAQLTGDGVLALFGAPVAHEDDAERAVRAALAVQEALSRYSAEIGPAYEIELAARVAVNTGPVVIPAGDATPDVLYNALGDTVNVAARLQSLGDLVVGPETARQVDAASSSSRSASWSSRGRPRAWPPSASQASERRPSRRVTPLVGRDDELGLLERILAELTEGRGAIVAITGEPGIGKSGWKRKRRRASRTGFASWRGTRSPTRRDSLLAVSRAATRLARPRRLRSRSPRPPGAPGRACGSARGRGRRGVPVHRDAARAATRARAGGAPRRAQQRQRAAADLRRRAPLVAALARERPLCLVLEDLQWADEATLALVEELFPATDEEVALLLFRTEGDQSAWDLTERARRRYRHRFEELQLVPLEQPEAVELASGAAGGALPDQWARSWPSGRAATRSSSRRRCAT